MAAKGCFWITVAFNAEDEPVMGRVGQNGSSIRPFNSLAKAKAQRKRWIKGTKYGGGTRLYHHYPRTKVFQCTYVAGVLMTQEIDCDE